MNYAHERRVSALIGVQPGRLDLAVAKQLLDMVKIRSRFEEVGGEGVPKHV